MEFGTIEREIHIDAGADVVYDVVSRPEHIREWWSAETSLEPRPGASGELTWRDEASGRVDVMAITVVDADPPHRFTFRWTHPAGEAPTSANSLLVTFDLVPSASGTTLRMTEVGFRERGWEVAVLEAAYRDHEQGWDFYLPRLAERATQLAETP